MFSFCFYFPRGVWVWQNKSKVKVGDEFKVKVGDEF